MMRTNASHPEHRDGFFRFFMHTAKTKIATAASQLVRKQRPKSSGFSSAISDGIKDTFREMGYRLDGNNKKTE